MSQDEQLFKDIMQAIESNELPLPTQPEIAVRIRETAEDPNVSVPMLGDIIKKDPALTARIIRIANSPLMRGSVNIDSIESAINRLGLNFVCNLAIGLAMEQIFQATNDQIDSWMREVWEHTTMVAAICNVIAIRYTKLNSSQALLAGLLSTIGILPILSYAQDHDELLEDPENFKKLLKDTSPKLGKAILSAWQFKDDIADVPFAAADPEYAPEEPDFISLVQIANCYWESNFSLYNSDFDKSELKVFDKIELDPSINILEDDDIKPDIDESVKLVS